MLDVVITKVANELRMSMHQKPTVQGIPLCSSSMHAIGVHRSWPTARFMHYESMCTEKCDSNKAKSKFVRKMRKFVPEHIWLQSQHRSYRHDEIDRKRKSSWIVLPFHRSLQCDVVKKAVEHADRCFSSLGIRDLGPRISWCNGYRSLAARVAGTYHAFINNSLSCGQN